MSMLCWLLQYFWYYFYSKNHMRWEFFDHVETLIAVNLLKHNICLALVPVSTQNDTKRVIEILIYQP